MDLLSWGTSVFRRPASGTPHDTVAQCSVWTPPVVPENFTAVPHVTFVPNALSPLRLQLLPRGVDLRSEAVAGVGFGQMPFGVDHDDLHAVPVEPTDHLQQHPSADRQDGTDEGQVEDQAFRLHRLVDHGRHETLGTGELEVALQLEKGERLVTLADDMSSAQHRVCDHRRVHQMQVHIAGETTEGGDPLDAGAVVVEARRVRSNTQLSR